MISSILKKEWSDYKKIFSFLQVKKLLRYQMYQCKCAQIQRDLLIYLFKIELLGGLREGKITVRLAKESQVWFTLSGIQKKSDILRNQDCTVHYPTQSNFTVFFLIVRHCWCGLPKMTGSASFARYMCLIITMFYSCPCLRYAPALRQLRQVAFLVTFPPTIPARLAGRLLEVMFVRVFSKPSRTVS